MENTQNLDGMLKDTYSKKKGGFRSLGKKACAKCGSTTNDMRGRLCDKCAFPKGVKA